MNKYAADVKLFHDKFGLVTPDKFTLLEPKLLDFRIKFLHEEFQEYVDAYAAGDLPTAIDSLIDLVYIGAGTALLHGINPTQFEQEEAAALPLDVTRFSMYGQGGEVGHPHLLSKANHEQLVKLLKRSIDDYATATQLQSQPDIKASLIAIYFNCLAGASWMGFTQESFNMLWDDVQKCNLAKERATRSEDSKRGSTYDIVKPAGWQHPRGKEIIEDILKQISA